MWQFSLPLSIWAHCKANPFIGEPIPWYFSRFSAHTIRCLSWALHIVWITHLCMSRALRRHSDTVQFALLLLPSHLDRSYHYLFSTLTYRWPLSSPHATFTFWNFFFFFSLSSLHLDANLDATLRSTRTLPQVTITVCSVLSAEFRQLRRSLYIYINYFYVFIFLTFFFSFSLHFLNNLAFFY